MRLLYYIIFIAVTTILITGTPALEPVAQDGEWLEARWLPDGKTMFTGANYRGIYIFDGTELDTVTTFWKAGYRAAISPDGEAIAFSGSEGPDRTNALFVYSLKSKTVLLLDNGGDYGPPCWVTSEIISVFDGRDICLFDKTGESLDAFDGGAYVTLVPSLEQGYFWCDRSGNFYRLLPDKKLEKLEYKASVSGFLFNPITNKSGEYILLEELGGPMVLISLPEFTGLKLPTGDYPSFVEEPFGILYLDMVDDGERITDSRVMFISIDNGEPQNPVELVESSPPERIFTRVDYSVKYGLLLTTQNGFIFRENFDLREALK